MLSFELIRNGVEIKPHFIAVEGEFGQSAYNAIELYSKHLKLPDSILKFASSK